MNGRLINIIGKAAIGIAALCAFPVSLMAKTAETIVVLDASNSMWGQVDGAHKVTLARAGLADLLSQQANQNHTGLVTYGNQRKSDCADISIVARPGELDTPSLLQQINTIRPYGRSPISDALQQAAGLLAENGSILLVSDGPESCEGNPCAVASQLKAARPALQIHVLSFQDNGDASLRCVAENTGGRFQLIQDAAQLAAVLFSPNAPASEKSATPAKSVDNTPGILKLSAGASGDDNNLPASFLIYNRDGDHVASFTSRTEITQTLPPGDYQASMLWRSTKLTQKLTLAPGQTIDHRFDLGDMGTLRLEALDAQQQPVDANFTLYAPDGDYLGEYLLKPRVDELLPAGTYRIKANAGAESQETRLEVSANQETSHAFRFRTLRAQ